jgi:hypothetical protein
MKAMAEIDAGPVLVKALGQEEAGKIAAKRASLIDSSEMRIVKFRSDLSYSMSPPQKTASVR